MEFIETSFFTKRMAKYFCDEGYADLQTFLAGCPDAGRLMRGAHGLRKLRWAAPLKGQGKRGGVRVVYFRMSVNRIYILDIYGKGEQENLPESQLRLLVNYLRGAK